MGELGFYITALFMGLAGSLHCLGMCGPIFLTASSFYDKPKQFAWPMVLHHLGKLLSYMGIGVIMGIVGKGVSLLWFQNRIMIVCGILLLVMAVGSLVKWKSFGLFNQWVTRAMGKALKKSSTSAAILGIVNGLVPCGLVYAAAVGAAATQSVAGAMGFMFAFGLGTIPALTFAGFSRWIMPLHRFKNTHVWKQIPMVILGVWLLLKGLGLGIPFISPNLGSHEPQKNCCRNHSEQ